MKINISIDDVSPHPLSSVKVLNECFDLISRIPEIKFTLFIPTAYWRTIKQGTATSGPLSIIDYPDFISFIENLPEKNFEICYHGLFHGIPGRSDNDEFQYLTYEEAIQKFSDMFLIVNKAGLSKKFKKIFRPPAWRMSPGAIKAATDIGIKTLALSRKDYAKLSYEKEDENFNKVVYYDVSPPFEALPEEQEKDSLEIVYHACEWDKNYLGKELKEDLEKWISKNQDIQFCFIEEL